MNVDHDSISGWNDDVLKDVDYPVDLDAFFTRINYTGTKDCTLENLAALQLAHIRNIPFENINIHLSKGINIEPSHIEDKLINQKLGGYCFELNSFFLQVLRNLGYSVTPVFARVRYNYPADLATGLTHILLIVNIDGRRMLVDVAFGGSSPSNPLDIDNHSIQETQYDKRRILPAGENGFMHQCMIKEEWVNLYYFTLQESYRVDWVTSNWLTSTKPDNIFSKVIMVCRVVDNARIILVNQDFKIQDKNGEVIEKKEIKKEKEYFEVLKTYFNLIYPEGTRICPPGCTWEN